MFFVFFKRERHNSKKQKNKKTKKGGGNVLQESDVPVEVKEAVHVIMEAVTVAVAAEAASSTTSTEEAQQLFEAAYLRQHAVQFGKNGQRLLSQVERTRNKLYVQYMAMQREASRLTHIDDTLHESGTSSSSSSCYYYDEEEENKEPKEEEEEKEEKKEDGKEGKDTNVLRTTTTAAMVVKNAHRMLHDRGYVRYDIHDKDYKHPLPRIPEFAATNNDRYAFLDPPLPSPSFFSEEDRKDEKEKKKKEEEKTRQKEKEGDSNDGEEKRKKEEEEEEEEEREKKDVPIPTAAVEIGGLPLHNKASRNWTASLFCVRVVARATFEMDTNDSSDDDEDDEDDQKKKNNKKKKKDEKDNVSSKKEKEEEEEKNKDKDRRKKEEEEEEEKEGEGKNKKTTKEGRTLRLACILHDADSGPLGVHQIRCYFSWLADHEISRVVFLLEKPLTSQALTEANIRISAMTWNLECEFFVFSELAFIAKDHELVPKHDIVLKRDQKKKLDELRVAFHQLPRIRSLDAIAKYYGYGAGDMVRITSLCVGSGSRVDFCRIV